MRKSAWTIAGLWAASTGALWLFSFFPIFGALAHVVLPTTVFVLLSVSIAALISTVRPLPRISYLQVVVGVALALTAVGLTIRHRFIMFGRHTVREANGKLMFTVRTAAIEEPQDENGRFLTRPGGRQLRYAIVERDIDYAVDLPDAATSGAIR